MTFTQSARTIVRWGGWLAAMAFGLAPAVACAERPPVPTVRLPLESLGFPGYVGALMHTGASMATVHLLDTSHLLFTYSLRSLVPRVPGDDENDTDRLVAGELISIPSGEVLARTEWHLHDHGQYLWNVGHGVFVLRMGDELSTFAPLRGLASGTAFQRFALPLRPGHPRVVAGSPDGKIIMVQVQTDSEASDSEGSSGASRKSKHTVIEFYRMRQPTKPEEPLALQFAGVVGAPGLLRLALDGDGYLWADDAPRNSWKVSFNEFEGKPQEITAISSSCDPRLDLVSRSQFLVTTCRGSDGAHLLSAYGFDGHETWQEPFGDVAAPPTIVSSPDAGRFAMSSLMTPAGSGLGDPSYVPYETLTQQIRVYQMESGDLLLNLQCSPVMRTSENFDLSPDGRMLAVLGKSAIELYKLPELSARDRKDLAEVQAMAPPSSEGPVVLRRIVRPIQVSQEEGPGTRAARRPLPAPSVAEGASAGGSGAVPDVGTPPATGAAEAAATGDAKKSVAASPAVQDASAVRRKPPTLLAPGETPEFKTKPEASPQE